MFAQEHVTPFLCLFNLGSKERHKMCYVQLYSSVKRPQYTPSETAFHDVSSEVYCGLLVFANVSNKERHAISIHNGVLEGGALRALLVYRYMRKYAYFIREDACNIIFIDTNLYANHSTFRLTI